jgi:hypothetical protein
MAGCLTSHPDEPAGRTVCPLRRLGIRDQQSTFEPAQIDKNGLQKAFVSINSCAGGPRSLAQTQALNLRGVAVQAEVRSSVLIHASKLANIRPPSRRVAMIPGRT